MMPMSATRRASGALKAASRARRKQASVSAPSVSRARVMTAGANARSPISMRKKEDPKMTATEERSTQSRGENAAEDKPRAVRGVRPGTAPCTASMYGTVRRVDC